MNEAWWPCYVEIPESGEPEKWIMLDRPCQDQAEAEALANSVLRPGACYRIASHDKILCVTSVPAKKHST